MNKRLLSIDVLRGMTLIFMIIVNTPGSWSHVYAPLLHADWNGLTPTDYIFPNFLFIVGVSIVLSLNNRKSDFNKNYKGDIAICYEIINLRSKKTNFNIEFDKMWIHGLLHLLGYDHARQKDYKQMLRKEQDILKRVN